MNVVHWQLIGWTMLHFLWIGSLVALAILVMRLALRRAGPNVRYTTTLLGFAALAMAPLVIAGWLLASGEFVSPPITAAVTPTAEPAALVEMPSVATMPANEEVIDLKYDPIELPVEAPAEPPPASVELAVEPTPESIAKPNAEAKQLAQWDPLALLEAITNYLPWLWLVGTPLTFLLLATGLVGSERMRRQATVLTEGTVYEAAARLRESLGIARQVTIAVSDRVLQPALLGIVRPLVLLPSAAVTGWTPAELEMALVHELAHVRRWDNLVNFVQRVVESLLFFHPAVWLVSRWLREGREQCCDAVVVAQCGDREGYAELLLNVARDTHNQRLPSMAVALTQHPLARRIRRILQLEDDPMLVSKRTLLFVATLFVAATVAAFWTNSSADEPGEPEASAPGVEEAASGESRDEGAVTEDVVALARSASAVAFIDFIQQDRSKKVDPNERAVWLEEQRALATSHEVVDRALRELHKRQAAGDNSTSNITESWLMEQLEVTIHDGGLRIQLDGESPDSPDPVQRSEAVNAIAESYLWLRRPEGSEGSLNVELHSDLSADALDKALAELRRAGKDYELSMDGDFVGLRAERKIYVGVRFLIVDDAITSLADANKLARAVQMKALANSEKATTELTENMVDPVLGQFGAEMIELIRKLKVEGRVVGIGVAEDGQFHVLGFGEAGVKPRKELSREDAESVLLQLVFTPKTNNPVETRDYTLPAEFSQHGAMPIGHTLKALQHDPFGPKLDFEWSWREESVIRVEAPKAAQWMMGQLVRHLAEESQDSGEEISETVEEGTREFTGSAESSDRIVLHPGLTEEELADIRTQLTANKSGFTISVDGPFVFLSTKDGVVKATRIEIDDKAWRLRAADGTEVPDAEDAVLVAEFLDFPAKVLGELLTATAKSLEPENYAIEVSQTDSRSLRLTARTKDHHSNEANFSSKSTIYDFVYKADRPFEGLRGIVAMYEETGYEVQVLQHDNQVEVLAFKPPNSETTTTEASDADAEIDTTINGASKTYHFTDDTPYAELSKVVAAHDKAGHDIQIQRNNGAVLVVVKPSEEAAAHDSENATDNAEWPVDFSINMSPMIMQAKAMDLAKRGKDFRSQVNGEWMEISYEGLKLVCKEVQVYPDHIVARDGKELIQLPVGKREVKRVGDKSPFPSLEDQRIADLAYGMFGAEVSRIDDEEVIAAVKAKGFRGGVVLSLDRRDQRGQGSSTYSAGIHEGDILVGLHVWPTANLEQLGEVLRRDDLDEFNPLKYYVLRQEVDPKWQEVQYRKAQEAERKREQEREAAGRGGFGGEFGGGFEGGRGRGGGEFGGGYGGGRGRGGMGRGMGMEDETVEVEIPYVWKLHTGRVRFDSSAWRDEQDRMKIAAAKEAPKAPPAPVDFAPAAPAVAPPTPPSETSKLKLLYDGKTFDQWRESFETELKVENRAEAIKALRAFGRAGYAKEAAETILEVAEEYDMLFIGSERTAVGALQTAIAYSFVDVNQSNPLPAEVAYPILLEWYREKPADDRLRLTQWILSHSYIRDPKLLGEVAKLTADGPGGIRQAALSCLVNSDRKLESELTQQTIGEMLADNDRQVVIHALRMLTSPADLRPNMNAWGFELPTLAPEMLALLFDDDPVVQKAARKALGSGSAEQLKPVVSLLTAVLKDPRADHRWQTTKLYEVENDSQVHQVELAALRALAATQEYGKPAISELTSWLEKDDDDLKIAACTAIFLIYGLPRDLDQFAGLPVESQKEVMKQFGVRREDQKIDVDAYESLQQKYKAELKELFIPDPYSGDFGGGGAF